MLVFLKFETPYRTVKGIKNCLKLKEIPIKGVIYNQRSSKKKIKNDLHKTSRAKPSNDPLQFMSFKCRPNPDPSRCRPGDYATDAGPGAGTVGVRQLGKLLHSGIL